MALTIAIEGKGSIAIADAGTEAWGTTGTISAPQDGPISTYKVRRLWSRLLIRP